MAHKRLAKSMSKIGGFFLFTPVACTVEVCLAAGPLKVRASLWNQNGPVPTPKPLQQPLLLCQDIATTPFLTWLIPSQTLPSMLVGRNRIESGLIINTGIWNEQYFWPEMLSVAYCSAYFSDKPNKQKSMFTPTGGPKDVPIVMLGAFSSGCGAVTCNIHPSYVDIKCRLDATDEFLLQILLLAQHVSGHHHAHHQELESIIQVVYACRIWCLVFKLSV
jgi:hypothetical protein